MGPFSGVYAPISGQIFEAGFATWADDVNAKGGIHGRSIRLKQVDNKYSADGGVAACKDVLSNGSFTAIEFGGQTYSFPDCLDKAGFVNFGGQAPQREFRGWQHTFLISAAPEVAGRSLASLVRNRMDGRGKRLGVIATPAVYRDYAEGYVAGVEELGMNLVGYEKVEANQASFTSELLRLQQAGAENVAVFAATESVGILRDARLIGYSPAWAGIGITFDFISKAARDLAKDVVGLRAWATIDTPQYEAFEKVVRQHGRSNEGAFKTEAFYAYGQALVVGHALDAAGRDLTEASFQDALHRFGTYDNGIVAPVSWERGRVVGTSASFPVKCCNSDWEYLRMGPAAATF